MFQLFSLGGCILNQAVARFKSVALYQPLVNGVGGNLAAIQASRMSTFLHMAKGKDIEKVFQDGSLEEAVNSDVCPVQRRKSRIEDNNNNNYHQLNISSSNSQSHKEKRYDWDETDQGQILSSFYLLYLSMQIPGGRLIDRFGPRRLCSLALLGTGVINLLLPLLVEHSYLLFIGSRILMGGLQATVFSSCYALVARWTPEQERSTVISLTSIGSAFGSMVTSSLSGHLCAHHGWPLVFHLSGIVITAIGLLYLVLVTDEPASSPYVSTRELAYISERLPKSKKGVQLKRSFSRSGTKNNSNFPWWTVLRSQPLLAVITVKLTMGLVYNLVMLKLPSYLSQVLRMDIEEVGFYSALIFGVKGLR